MSYDFSLNPVLEKANNDDLQYLVEIITNAMTNALDSDELYKKYRPDHKKYVGVKKLWDSKVLYILNSLLSKSII